MGCVTTEGQDGDVHAACRGLTWGGKQMHTLYEKASLALGRVLTLSRDDLKREDGQGATEYGILIAFVVLSIALTIGVMGTAITDFLGRVAGKLDALVP